MNATVIYLRTKSIATSSDKSPLPRKGAPVGAIAYTVDDNVLEVAYALQNPKDKWDRERCRRMVEQRLELKRETCTRQGRAADGRVDEFETVPKYFRITIDEPVLSTDEPQPTRPYDVLQLIVEAEKEGQIRVPERLIKTIKRMQSDNEHRVRILSELPGGKVSVDSSTTTSITAAAVVVSQ